MGGEDPRPRATLRCCRHLLLLLQEARAPVPPCPQCLRDELIREFRNGRTARLQNLTLFQLRSPEQTFLLLLVPGGQRDEFSEGRGSRWLREEPHGLGSGLPGVSSPDRPEFLHPLGRLLAAAGVGRAGGPSTRQGGAAAGPNLGILSKETGSASWRPSLLTPGGRPRPSRPFRKNRCRKEAPAVGELPVQGSGTRMTTGDGPCMKSRGKAPAWEPSGLYPTASSKAPAPSPGQWHGALDA